MKPRSPQKSPFDSSKPEPAGIGRVQRIHRASQPAPTSPLKIPFSNGERSFEPEVKAARTGVSSALTWIVALVAIITLLCAIFLWIYPRSQASAERKAPAKILEKPRHLPEWTADDALRFLKQAVAIQQPSQVEHYFHLGATTPEQAIDFLKSQGAPSGFDEATPAFAHPKSPVMLAIYGEQSAQRRLAILVSPDGKEWKIDFAAFARPMNSSWEDFLSEKNHQIEARMNVHSDYYFNGVYSDEKTWVCYQIASPDLEETLFGYCKVSSPQASALEQLSKEGMKSGRFLLELQKVVGAERRQVEIKRVLARDWVKTKDAYDSQFGEK